MVTTKELTLKSLSYQSYLTYVGIIWTLSISLLIAIGSYILININKILLRTFLILGLILIFIEIIFIAVYFWINNKKENIKKDIENS